MEESLRSKRQRELANIWLNSNQFGIILAAPRMGKCRMSLLILNMFPVEANVLIVIPDNKIKKSWEDVKF